jgi:hypothetical protein
VVEEEHCPEDCFARVAELSLQLVEAIALEEERDFAHSTSFFHHYRRRVNITTHSPTARCRPPASRSSVGGSILPFTSSSSFQGSRLL